MPRSYSLLSTLALSALALLGLGCEASLAHLIGSAEAAPKKGGGEGGTTMDVQAVDIAVPKRATPRLLSRQEKRDMIRRKSPVEEAPKFAIKRLDAQEIGDLLGSSDPLALPKRVFDARHTYHDDSTYMEILAYQGSSVGVRPLRNYLHFNGSPEVMSSPSLRPSVVIHFRAEANTRYLLECAVDASSATTFRAADMRAEYSVHTDDRSTLLYLRDQAGAIEDVYVQVSGDSPAWYLDGCELTASPR